MEIIASLGIWRPCESHFHHENDGVRFENAFVTCAVCSPSRSAMVTGRYQTTLGVHNHRSQNKSGKSGGHPTYFDDYQHPATFCPLFDGNGNITQYLNQEGELTASFEYNTFGDVATKNVKDKEIKKIAYRFSTKPIEPESGWYYYGYRYYDPGVGRWLSRDPIEERGGVNLFRFAANDAVGSWDVLGLQENYVNQTAAAWAAIKKAFPQSQRESIEYGGRVCKNPRTSRHVYTQGKGRGTEDYGANVRLGRFGGISFDQMPKCPLEHHCEVAFWHTHRRCCPLFSQTYWGMLWFVKLLTRKTIGNCLNLSPIQRLLL